MSEPGSPQLEIGLEATCERIVTQEWTLSYYEPGLPPVFSTPAMIGLMEMATVKAIHHALPVGTITVGTRIEVDHLKSAPLGASIAAHARLVEMKGRYLTFDVAARNGDDLIGKGRVFRALVKQARFAEKAASKSSS